ncbi:hypothetical protein [Brachyspira catarrhinii]|uniref:Uncharacterized protein n=1 Tax=Brachyspira catarrhinii TaxID=2528966 RepID=A0ABY2TU87_9SPIR|nr:hypothetical protein [Brachyspira catarrhinii]TKZ36038.1 hypothetical protein EZH24_02125 [Brachyspira catarrhinii]
MQINKFLIISAIFLSCFAKLYCEETNGNNKKGLQSPLDNRFFSIGLFSSADSVKTSVNLEFGFKLFKFNNFEMKSYTSIVGSKIYDDSPQMYELGFMEKITFGGVDEYKDKISVGRYGFAFVSLGALSFNANKDSKFLFSKPLYWEVGGGAGFNINISRHVTILLEFGGGLHIVVDGKNLGYPSKINKAGFGRISLGGRYYIN